MSCMPAGSLSVPTLAVLPESDEAPIAAGLVPSPSRKVTRPVPVRPPSLKVAVSVPVP